MSARNPKARAAWGTQTIGEMRWPASLAVLVALLLYVTLPQRLTLGPVWLVPLIELALLVPLSVAAPRRVPNEATGLQIASMSLIGVVNISNIASLVLLVDALVHGNKATGSQLLLGAVQIWLTNVIVFGLWYWELDRGGPDARASTEHRQPDFLFPQMVTPDCTHPLWSPKFFDYLYVSFTNATAFSPTDTLPLTIWAKMLMMVQSLASLLTVALVAARAVNILT